jgi:hypothetical protein
MRNADPYFLMLRLGGNKSSVCTPRTLAKMYSSPSGTRRCSVSNLASDSRLMSQPKSWSFADRSCCVQPFRSRILRTCRPIKFNGGQACLMKGTVTKPPPGNCSIQVTTKRLPIPFTLGINSRGREKNRHRCGMKNLMGPKRRNAAALKKRVLKCLDSRVAITTARWKTAKALSGCRLQLSPRRTDARGPTAYRFQRFKRSISSENPIPQKLL